MKKSSGSMFKTGRKTREKLIRVQGDHSACDEPLRRLQNKSSSLACLGQARPGQKGSFVLKSTGGFAQRDVSPCTTERVWVQYEKGMLFGEEF